MIIPWPEIEKGIGETEEQYGDEPDAGPHLQAPEYPPERQAGQDIDEHLRLHKADHLGSEYLHENGGDHPKHPSQRSPEIPEWQLPPAHTVSSLPGKKYVYPVGKGA